ncbi:MAG: ATP-binding protein, partial [Rhodospirillaceae bacterium]
LNLAINARDAMPDGGRLRIETSNIRFDEDYAEAEADLEPGSYVMVAVSDNGHGMLPEVQERAVEPFFTTKDTGQGSGLGLSMIYGFAKQSGGHMRIYSEPGQGTVVRLFLPTTRDIVGEAKRTSESDQDRYRSRGERILVVEDDPEVRQITAVMLQKLGYGVLEAETGQEAIDLTDSGAAFDLLFSDVFLRGGMNGPDAARRIKQARPDLPVLFTSGYSADQISGDDILGERVQLISKPFELA